MGPKEKAYDQKTPSEEQVIAVLKDAQAGIGVQELCRKHGISDATFYKWRATYSGLEVSERPSGSRAISRPTHSDRFALGHAHYCAILKKNNRSGISGAIRVDRVEMCKGRRQRKLYWEAQWPIGNGRSRHRKFSILKYGEEGAYQMALAASETALEALSSQTFSPFAALSSRKRRHAWRSRKGFDQG
jgi:hypothetical protein